MIECSWDELLLAIKDDVRDFDGLIAAHATFVSSLVTRAFLDTVSKVPAGPPGGTSPRPESSRARCGPPARLAVRQDLLVSINKLLEHIRQFIVAQACAPVARPPAPPARARRR